MQKAPRFMIEYANFQIGKLESNSAMNEGIKNELIGRITKAVFYYRAGAINVDETMRILSAPVHIEDMSEYIK